MRRAAKTDNNQSTLVKQMRAIGMSVFVTSGLGDNFPDLVTGYRSINHLWEIKNPNKPPSKRKLRQGQQLFFNTWKGTVYKVETSKDVLKIINQ
jgi:hypothetical protein